MIPAKNRQTSNISRSLIADKLVVHSDVVGDVVGASNYIFILDLTSEFNESCKENCKARLETSRFWDLVRFILEVLWQVLLWHPTAMGDSWMIKQCTVASCATDQIHKSNNAPVTYSTKNRMRPFLFWMVSCGIRDRRIAGFAGLITHHDGRTDRRHVIFGPRDGLW